MKGTDIAEAISRVTYSISRPYNLKQIKQIQFKLIENLLLNNDNFELGK
mgnify:CR=1 FL=1